MPVNRRYLFFVIELWMKPGIGLGKGTKRTAAFHLLSNYLTDWAMR